MNPCNAPAQLVASLVAVVLLPTTSPAQYRPNNSSTLHSYSSPYAHSSMSSRAQKLEVGTFNLTPHEQLGENTEQVRSMADGTVDVVKTMLYSQSGEKAAAAQGRCMWYDRNTLQLTVTDHPENIKRVSDFVRSSITMGSKKRSEIVFLKHQSASDASSFLGRVTGSGGSGAGQPQTGNAVTRTLRVEGELTFRDLKIRITRINENDASDRNDDSVEMVIRTPTNSEDRTIEEFRSEFIDAYEINVIEVRPSGTPGEGSARIEVRYNPAATGR